MKRYDVEINGVRTTLQLSDADAKARGLIKPAAEEKKAAPTKARTAANKSRTAANKSGNAG
ncbi:hypothetical protein A5733_03010 [Mycobacterium sp. NS-7484]|uniref:hypothetical protein n=1 Tax=Mycobacterium sp. NS-7484 TaxID=1834161 RepID=UPI00096C978C|nr:hypothetical protein [Mycobacterium sp. NS-7484]OMC01281.1 hypothetical protein A5733_03010 [Mycobacterium sp. NS-7484]